MSSKNINRSRLAGLLLGSLAGLGLTSAASAQNSNFSHVPNAAISGHNNKALSNVSVRDCMNACISERGFECKSFDYNKTTNACDLSDKRAVDVGGLKRDYAGNPYDHYEKSDVVEISASVGTGDAESKPAKDIMTSVLKMSGPESILVEADLDGFSSKYGDAIQQGDHVQGITMTESGRIVLAYSRQGTSSQPCSGMLVYSSPLDPDNPDEDLTWSYYCSSTDGPEGHPSAIQATGEVVIVGTHGGSRFYHIKPGRGGVQPLRHLDMTTGGRNASGIVYNHNDNRYYALNANGPTTALQAWTTLCRTDPGESLFDTSTRFDECKSFSAYASGQGSNLVMDQTGGMFLISAFSSADESKEGSWGAYGVVCESTTVAAAFGGYDVADEFEDRLLVSTVNWQSGINLARTVELQRTQRAQTCVHKRPSFRFAGGVATNAKGELIALWSGRQNPPLLPVTDQFEFAFQNLSTAVAPAKTIAYNAAVDCAVDDITDEGTTSTITATFMDRNRNVLGSARQKDISAFNCATEDIDFEANLRGEAEFVKLSTDGSDGFMVDLITLYKNGNKVRSYGANNDKGWCFSTDPGDGKGSWNYAADGICVPHHTWSFSGASVAGNPYDIARANMGTTNVTSVRYRFDIDCDVLGIENEGTNSTITGIMYDANGNEIGRGSHKKDTNNWVNNCEDIQFDVVTRGKASRYRIMTDGGDAAMLDQIFLYENGKEVDVEGVSNRTGWCLSTQESDAHGNWQGFAYQDTCRPYWDFDL